MGDDEQGDFEPLISEGLFTRVQARLSGKRTTEVHRRLDDPDFPLRRFVRCESCNTPLTGSSPRGRRKNYSSYSCRKGCQGISVRKEALEGQFVRLLESLQPKPEYLNLFKAVVLDRWNNELNRSRSRRTP